MIALLENNQTLAWKLYEQGRDYNNRLTPNQYQLVETNTEFFAGNQWLHLPDTPAMRGLPKPTFNILKRVASLFVASLTSSGVALHVEPLDCLADSDSVREAAEIADAEIANLLEKLKIEYRIRDALFDGAQTGDYCAHFYFDPEAAPYSGAFGNRRGEIKMELIDGINIMFGNPNCNQVENQPYILILGRDTVERLRDEAAYWRRRELLTNAASDINHSANPDFNLNNLNNFNQFQPDHETRDFPGVGGQTELQGDESGKALYILLYTKSEKIITDSDGQPRREYEIHVTKATRGAVIYENINTGLSRYPIAWGNWEKQKYQYHGRALITGMIPNQIFINTMFATAMRHLQLMAFPRTVFNADLISAWTNEVGQAVAVRGLQPGQDIASVARNLPAAEMSAQIFQLIDKAMLYTRECLGAVDVQLGSAPPDNTSALMILQTNAEAPLENIRANLYEWLEDIGAILLDMMGTYYGRRPVAFRRGRAKYGAPDHISGHISNTPEKNVIDFDFSVLKPLWFSLRTDTGASSRFDEIALSRTLDDLRRDGVLNSIQYLERLPNRFLPRKDELISELRRAPDWNAPPRDASNTRTARDTRNTDAARDTRNTGVNPDSPDSHHFREFQASPA